MLLDLKMPGMDGETALVEMLRVDPAVRVVVMSGYSESEASTRVGARGAVLFLQKPFDYASLLAAVDAALPDRP